MTDVDQLCRRLAARGYFEISPGSRGVVINWAPTGQAGPNGGRHRFNPFCTRGWSGTLTEALERAVADTAPPQYSLETLVAHMLYQEERKRAEAQ